MCGTPLQRVGILSDMEHLAATEEIAGFFIWCDIKGYDAPSLYRYAQPCDPLIEEGWSVA